MLPLLTGWRVTEVKGVEDEDNDDADADDTDDDDDVVEENSAEETFSLAPSLISWSWQQRDVLTVTLAEVVVEGEQAEEEMVVVAAARV